MSDKDVIKNFLARLYALPIVADPKYLAEDIRTLRATYAQSSDFEDALHAVMREIGHACQNHEHGKALQYSLAGWRRSRFQLRREPQSPAELRLIFQEQTKELLYVLAFGPRKASDSIYFRASSRLPETANADTPS